MWWRAKDTRAKNFPAFQDLSSIYKILFRINFLHKTIFTIQDLTIFFGGSMSVFFLYKSATSGDIKKEGTTSFQSPKFFCSEIGC